MKRSAARLIRCVRSGHRAMRWCRRQAEIRYLPSVLYGLAGLLAFSMQSRSLKLEDIIITAETATPLWIYFWKVRRAIRTRAAALTLLRLETSPDGSAGSTNEGRARQLKRSRHAGSSRKKVPQISARLTDPANCYGFPKVYVAKTHHRPSVQRR